MIEKKKKVLAKKHRKKTGFLGFSDITSGERFAYLLYSSDQAQTYRVATFLIVEGEQIIKMTSLVKKSKFYAEKIRKKNGFFWGFPTILQENAWENCCIDPIELKITG